MSRLSKEQLEPIIDKYSEKYRLSKNLIYSVIMVESAGDPYAVRYESHWKYVLHPDTFAKIAKISLDTEIFLQKCSYGLMQVMGTVARELGYRDNLLKLHDPDLAIDLGSKKLRQLSDKYMTTDDVISAYNQGIPKKNGPLYVNQDYVTKVRSWMNKKEL